MTDRFNILEKDTRDSFYTEFDRIAKKLLNKFQLKTLKNLYLIRELEFYYYSENHKDCYCHKNPRQLLNSSFYFHRFKDPEKYGRLKQKGIDITIGNTKDSYGGILIRAIQDCKSNEIITGIGNLTNRIIEDIGGTEEINGLYELNNCALNSDSGLRLESTQNNGLKIFKKPRQGLNHKKEDSERFFINAFYNYFTYPEIIELK